MKILRIRPPHLSDAVTLPWEIQKGHFQQYYSYILLIIRYITSEGNKTASYNLATASENVTTLTCEMQRLFI